MDALYRSLADGTRTLQDTLRAWAEERLAEAGLEGPVSLDPDATEGIRLSVVKVAPGAPPEVGADFSLMGRWGSGAAPSNGEGSVHVPPEWPAIGHAVRSACERLLTPEGGEPGIVPPPTLLAVKNLPPALAAWFRAQPPVRADKDWPEEGWTVEQEGVEFARLPFLTWYPGFDLSLRYAFDAAPGPAAGPALAVLSTAAQVERSLRLPVPPIELPPAIASLIEALSKAPRPAGCIDPAELLAAATTRDAQDLSLRILPADEPRRILVATELPLARGPRLVPGSTLLRRTAPPQRRASTGRAGT